MADQAIGQLGLEPGRLGRHHLARIGNCHQCLHAGREQGECHRPVTTVHALLQFRHAAGKDAHAPGFYLHLEPGECFIGVGLWRPETKVAYAIRERIDAERAEWKRATRSEKFTTIFEMGGDSLVRPPKGYDEDHPLIDDLKRKDFIASRRLTQKQVTGDDFMDEFAEMCMAARPYMRFLCRAVGVPFDKGDA